MLVPRDKAAHWYKWVEDTQAILPCYLVPLKDGSGMRSATLADARKLNLMIGISSVANILPKPQLEAWKTEQAIMAALTLPRLPDEPMDAFARRCVEDMNAQSLTSRTFGSQIHQAIEDHLNGIQRLPSHLMPYLDGFMEWAKENIEDIHALELIVGDPAIGIAGRLDIDCTLRGFGKTILDVKTQGIKKGKPTFYNEWIVQLSAYEHCRRREDGIHREVASVVINSIAPDKPHVNVWLGGKERGWQIFQHCLALWKFTSGYDPSQSAGGGESMEAQPSLASETQPTN